jgi:HEAT repeat protein
VLLTALRSDDEELQAAAAEVVGDWGKAAAGFSAALAKIASNAKDPQARAAAVTALGDIAAADQAETLGKSLDDDDADVRHAAAYAIADLPEIVAGLEAAIVAAADDDDVRVRMEIAPTLARLGTPAAKKALDALANDEDGNVADVAKQVAGKTSVKAK